jgi:beta-glucosidase
MAKDSIVLLKNEQNLLPLKKGELKNILVIGPNALYRQLGGYSAGQSANIDTLVNIMALEGIRSEAAGITVNYEKGWCSAEEFRKGGIFEALPGFDPADSVFDLPMSIEEMRGNSIEDIFPRVNAEKRHVPEDPDYQGDSDKLFARALEAAKKADVVIVVAGTDTTISSEEHDRENLKLPYDQDEKIQKLLDVNKRTVVVLTTIGSVTGAFLDKAHTLVNATFAGQAQGTAIANILFGKVNPNAKLTATWYKNLEDLPIINDYGIKKQDTYEKKGRTYMYFDGPVQFPFGHGLSYTRYEYGKLNAARAAYDANETLEVSVDVTNAGSMDGAEIVQLYVAKVLAPKVRDNKPVRQLKAWEKVWLKAGETKKVTLRLPLRDIAFWSNFQNKMVVENGTYTIMAGPSSAVLPSETQIQETGAWKAALSSVYALADKQVYAIGGRGKITVSATLEDTTHLCPGEYSPVFASSDEKTASVDGQGLVTAKAAGTALITATVSYDGVTKSAVIPVAVK